jgi:hypothetical protein
VEPKELEDEELESPSKKMTDKAVVGLMSVFLFLFSICVGLWAWNIAAGFATLFGGAFLAMMTASLEAEIEQIWLELKRKRLASK